MSKFMDVIVVGCGASGIAALRRLHDAGLNVMGLEVMDRIGGRICTVEFGDNCVDLGAAWCHGEKDNDVFELVEPYDLLGRPDPEHKWFVQSNGDIVENKIADEILEKIDAIVASADKNNTLSISKCIRSGISFNKLEEAHSNLTFSLIEWYERNNHVGGQRDPKAGKSLKGLTECWNCEGEQMLNWKGRGYRTVLDVLLKKIPNPADEIPVSILLNKEVESIKWRSNHLVQDPDHPLVQVKCKDGSLYAAKSVIVTVSIGVLKEQHNKLFNPQLPTEKVNTINSLQLCVLNKIYIEFEKPWWPKRPANFAILWRNEDRKKFSQEEKWLTEVYGFWTVEHQPNILLAWIYGTGAEMVEKISVETVKTGIHKLMKIVFKEFELTPIKSILRSQWASQPFTRGAYSYRSVATEEKGGSATILSEPLYHGETFPIVCFGGEATSHHRHGAVHGAVEAGFREADRLIENWKRFKK